MTTTNTRKKTNKTLKIILIFLSVVLLIFALFCAYVRNYYKADKKMIENILETEGQTYCETLPYGYAFIPNEPVAGIIFYPGAKVECSAYIPLMNALSLRGYLCVLLEMPFNMAIFDVNAADGITSQYPYISDWYMAGHSMGGAMAASYISKHSDEFKGLFLLAAYSSVDISGSDLLVVSIYGSEDHVLNHKFYEKFKKNLPPSPASSGSNTGFLEYIIDGGCHAFFGCYGAQKGDGTPTISNEKQIEIVADYLAYFINNNGAHLTR